MNTFNASISIINKFCDNFKKTFSKKQFQAFQTIVYGLILKHKRANISTITKALNTNYQKLQFFLSEADWNYDELNAQRIQVLKNQRTTGFSKNGLLIKVLHLLKTNRNSPTLQLSIILSQKVFYMITSLKTRIDLFFLYKPSDHYLLNFQASLLLS